MAFNRQQSNEDVEITNRGDGESRPNNQRRRGDGNDRFDGGDRNNQRQGQGRGRRDGGGDDRRRGVNRNRENDASYDYDGEETKQPRKAANNKAREQIINNDAFPEL